ncbi:MAG TPA: adenylate/guanylate cyclase domain-containing protein [Azospirillaceae bacterium]|nr:adenylate/guanylate cyclase domain-containing protein [Azospirillaceae bacterium]
MGRVWVGLTVAMAVTVAVLMSLRFLPPLTAADRLVEDQLMARFSAPEPQHSGIVVIGLGEETFAALACRSPVDRDFLAVLVKHLETSGVRAIGLDILFDQPTRPDADKRLHRILATATVPVVAITARALTPLSPRQRAFHQAFLDGIPQGYANLAKDRLDGAVRWHVPAADGGLSFPAAVASALGVPVPTAAFRIAWHGRPDAGTAPFPVYPAELVSILPGAWLAGRVALVGAMVPGDDRHRTSLSHGGEDTPGVEIQAHVLAQLLDNRRHPRISLDGEAVTTGTLALVGVGLAAAGLPLWAGALAGILMLGAMWGGSALLYAAGGPLVPPLAPSLGVLGGLGAMAVYLSLSERADRRVLMELFAHHVSEPVAREIWRERVTFMAGGRPRPQELTATVLFSDIAGFTPVCETLAPEPLMRWVETYLETMVRVVAAHDGIVLRFIGDAILAVFGVPVARSTQAEIDADAHRAVACALTMRRELEDLNRRWQAEGLPPVGIRVGIHTGTMVAGSLGGLRHREYSLLGDTVNVAARFEALGKTLEEDGSCPIVIGEATWKAVRGMIATRPVGTIQLKGKREAVRAWQVLSNLSDSGRRS